MNKNRFVKFFFIFFLCFLIILFIYIKFFQNNKSEIAQNTQDEVIYNSNIIQDVEYTTKDKNNNEYFIKAAQGEIDFANSSIIFLTDVYALIKLENSENVTIFSDYGKYNSENYDTIFTKNVIINYLENKITGEYVDFSLERNSMIISKNVIYNNPENILQADVIEMNIKNKDTKIFMYEEDKKVNVKSKN